MNSLSTTSGTATGRVRRRFRLSLGWLLSAGTATVLAGGIASAGPVTFDPGRPATLPAMNARVINMAQVPQQSASTVGVARAKPLLTGHTAAQWASIKAAAATSTAAPTPGNPLLDPPSTGTGTFTPGATTAFLGMSNSGTTCPYFSTGCAPPDQALASSQNFIFQGVNTSFAVYSPTGLLQAGWPKNAQSFFGVPNPGTCDSHGPFLSDPRAFFDSNANRFWVSMLQVEGAFGINSCPFQSLYWIAVSQTSDPRGAWNIYAIDMSDGTNAADYTQFGFDPQAVYVSGNLFNQAGTAFVEAKYCGLDRFAMQKGNAVTPFCFFNPTASASRTVSLDTLNPVEAQNSGTGPRAGFFVNTYNMQGDPFGNDCHSSACSSVIVWAMAKPGTSSESVSGAFASSNAYIAPPGADEPGCTGCIETLDTRISGTPVYRNGFISYALETGVNNGSQVVPGILWGQINPILNNAAAITSANAFQGGYYFYGGDSAASFGALMPDEEGNLTMVFEFMNSSINPESAYVSRRATWTPGAFRDNGLVLFGGAAPFSFSSRWGDYEAASTDGRFPDHIWIAGEHSNASGNWSTGIGKAGFASVGQQ